MSKQPTPAPVYEAPLLAENQPERRAHDRYPVRGTVMILRPDEIEPLVCSLTNISSGGAFIQTRARLWTGTRVRIALGTDGAYDVKATVVRSSRHGQPSGIGVRFDPEEALSPVPESPVG